MRYVASLDKKRVATDLKPVYRALNVEAAEQALASGDERYPMIANACARGVGGRWDGFRSIVRVSTSRSYRTGK
jgi:hypothetical protein